MEEQNDRATLLAHTNTHPHAHTYPHIDANTYTHTHEQTDPERCPVSTSFLLRPSPPRPGVASKSQCFGVSLVQQSAGRCNEWLSNRFETLVLIGWASERYASVLPADHCHIKYTVFGKHLIAVNLNQVLDDWP